MIKTLHNCSHLDISSFNHPDAGLTPQLGHKTCCLQRRTCFAATASSWNSTVPLKSLSTARKALSRRDASEPLMLRAATPSMTRRARLSPANSCSWCMMLVLMAVVGAAAASQGCCSSSVAEGRCSGSGVNMARMQSLAAGLAWRHTLPLNLICGSKARTQWNHQ